MAAGYGRELKTHEGTRSCSQGCSLRLLCEDMWRHGVYSVARYRTDSRFTTNAKRLPVLIQIIWNLSPRAIIADSMANQIRKSAKKATLGNTVPGKTGQGTALTATRNIAVGTERSCAPSGSSDINHAAQSARPTVASENQGFWRVT